MSGPDARTAAPDLSSWRPRPAAPPEFRAHEKVWVLSRHADVTTAFRHPDLAIVEASEGLRGLATRAGLHCPFLQAQFRGVLPNTNPPWHTTARRFSRVALRLIEDALPAGAIGGLADRVLDALPRGEAFDVMPMCDDMPVRVVAHGLGVPDDVVRGIVDGSIAVYGGLRRRMPLRLLPQFEAMAASLSSLVSERLDGTATLDAIRRSGRDEFGLTPAEMDALLAFLLVAATETTTAFLGSAVQLLGLHPEVPAMSRADSASRRLIFEELLRYCTPAGPAISLRIATQPLPLDDVTIPRDSLLVLDTARAHFDPAAYPDPERFDPRRRGPPHFGFGGGAHVCLGAAFAREHAIALLSRLMDRFDIEPQRTPLDWCRESYMRRLRHLSITLHPRS
jgi:cytochrome P450